MPTPSEERPSAGLSSRSDDIHNSPRSVDSEMLWNTRDANDDNTGAGMANAQEHGLFVRARDSMERLYSCEAEKQQHERTVTAPIDMPRSPISLVDDDQDSCQDPAAPPTDPEARLQSLPATLKTHTSALPTALFNPSPPPTSSTEHRSSRIAGKDAAADADVAASDFSLTRLTPAFTSSFFHSGSRFKGTQQSQRQIYNVDVEINDVSVLDSSVNGYLRICGLTDSHPTLTTYFEGEIIGTHHTFQTRHPGWGATDKTDMQHWARFPAWRPLAKEARKPGFSFAKGWWSRESIFMRWKELFLVPDHRVTNIQGASFEGFYYICLNQVEGRISGIYFHAKSENAGINDRFQQLELRHVPDNGTLGAIEFR